MKADRGDGVAKEAALERSNGFIMSLSFNDRYRIGVRRVRSTAHILWHDV